MMNTTGLRHAGLLYLSVKFCAGRFHKGLGEAKLDNLTRCAENKIKVK